MSKESNKIYPPFPKRILFLGMSIFLMAQSYQAILVVPKFQDTSMALQFFIAIILNLFITGIFAFAGFALPTERLMPARYYEIRSPKKLKHWYKRLKIEWFRKFLLTTVWKNKKMQKDYFDGKMSGLDTFETKTKKSEFGHLIPLFLIFGVVIYLIINRLWWAAVFTFLINIIFNFYTIPLQRHHRSRLTRLRKILVAKNKQ